MELTKAVERHTLKEAHVIPVILRDCDWQDLPIGNMCLGDLQALPKDALPIDDWTSRDKAFANIARGIRKTITQVQQEQEAKAERQRQEAEAAKRRQREQEEAERKRQEAERQEAEAAKRRQREQVEAERQRREAEAQRQREEAERQRQRDEYYNGGIYHLNQGNLDQAIADLTQAKQLGHPQAAQKLAEAEQLKQTTEDDLNSEKGIDYTRLRGLLKAQDWKAADQETAHRMLEAVGRGKDDWIRPDELLFFPCADLLTIDRLWVKYSQGRFGFSVQKQIYVKCGAKLDDQYPGDTTWGIFGDKVGWRVNESWILYKDVTFSTSAPQGHLPRGRDIGRGGWWGEFSSLASRLVKCKP